MELLVVELEQQQQVRPLKCLPERTITTLGFFFTTATAQGQKLLLSFSKYGLLALFAFVKAKGFNSCTPPQFLSLLNQYLDSLRKGKLS